MIQRVSPVWCQVFSVIYLYYKHTRNLRKTNQNTVGHKQKRQEMLSEHNEKLS